MSSYNLIDNILYIIGGWQYKPLECEPVLAINLDNLEHERIKISGTCPPKICGHSGTVINR